MHVRLSDSAQNSMHNRPKWAIFRCWLRYIGLKSLVFFENLVYATSTPLAYCCHEFCHAVFRKCVFIDKGITLWPFFPTIFQPWNWWPLWWMLLWIWALIWTTRKDNTRQNATRALGNEPMNAWSSCCKNARRWCTHMRSHIHVYTQKPDSNIFFCNY